MDHGPSTRPLEIGTFPPKLRSQCINSQRWRRRASPGYGSVTSLTSVRSFQTPLHYDLQSRWLRQAQGDSPSPIHTDGPIADDALDTGIKRIGDLAPV